MSLVTRQYGPDAKGEKLSKLDMDNNLYYLQSIGVSGMTFSANTLTLTNPTGGTITNVLIDVNTDSRWYIPSGTTVEIDSYSQSFIYGDLYVFGTLLLNENSKLIVLNGDVYVLSGGTISGSGQTVLVDLPTVNDLITSGTYSGGTLTLSTSNGTDVTVNGFFTGTTDVFTTGATYNDGIIYFDTNVSQSAYTVNISSLTGDSNTFLTASTYNSSTNTITLTDNTNTTFNAYIDSVSGLTVNGTFSATTISGGTFYGDGSNLTGISSLVNYSNVSFVDAVNGNNTTATINDFTKPFTTIPLAISALVTAGQTNRGLVYVRRGTYNNNIVNLVDGIDVYCEPGVILGGDSRVRDNSVDVTSNFFGYAKILNTSNVAVLDIKGNSFVTFEFDEIICNGAAFEVNTPTTNNKILIKGNNIFASTLGFGYGSTIRGASNVVVRIAGDINSVHQVIRFRFFTGSAEIYANRILLRDGNIYGGAWDQCLYIDNASSTGNITIKSDLISQKSTYGGSTDAMVRFWDNPNANVQIYGNIITIINEGVIMSSGNSKLTFSGVIKGSRTMFSVNGSSVVNIKDSTIIRSGSTVAGPINITDSGLAYINDTTMYSEFLDGNIINIESNTASLFIKDMVAQGVGSNYFVNVGTATPTVGLINAVSNKDNHPSFVNAYTVAGSFYLEPNLNVPKFI